MEERKASEVLLEIEATVNNILKILNAQDLSIKILSNKINILQKNLSSSTPNNASFSQNKNIVLAPNQEQLQNLSPDPESLTRILNQPLSNDRRGRREDIKKINSSSQKNVDEIQIELPIKNTIVENNQNSQIEEQRPSNSVTVMQKVVDQKNKSIFLADVEILDASNNCVAKPRTNGMGKWSAALPIGYYKVIIRKLESITKERKEFTQNIKIDGSQNPYFLENLILKS